jgi:integrase
MSGHIRKRGRNSWELKFDAPRDDGQRRPVYRSFKGSKREAQAELTRLVAQAQSGGFTEPTKLTVIQHVRNRVALWRANGSISARTEQGYREAVMNRIAPFPIALRPLQKLSSADIERWHVALRTQGRRDGNGGIAPRTINQAHKVLKKCLDDAVRHKLVLRNAAAEQPPPKIKAEPMIILTPDRVKELPAKLAGLPICAPAVTALFTGMRRGELLALRHPDVDLDRKVIRVRAALEQTKEHGVRFKETKTKAGVRLISLPEIVVETLREHLRQQLELRFALGLGRPPGNALVFPSPGTERLWPPDSFSAAWGDLGLDVSFHGLRHTHASMLIAQRVPITEIAHRLGHSSPAVTLSIYAHMFEKDDSNSAAAINAALRQ